MENGLCRLLTAISIHGKPLADGIDHKAIRTHEQGMASFCFNHLPACTCAHDRLVI
jgi:hypothetical protein